MGKVILAEKPSVARRIAAVVGAINQKDGYLEGNGYQVTWAYGHLITLCEPQEPWSIEHLPILPDKWPTEPTGKIIKGKRQPDFSVIKQLKVISTLFKSTTEIISATDASREGELIFRHIYEYLSVRDNFRTPYSRLWVSSLTDKAIKEGMSHLLPGDKYNNLADAAKGRAQADWLVGMNATRTLTLTMQAKNPANGVFSIGRVQTPTLGMVCKRFLENRDFVSTPYYILSVQTTKEQKILTAKNPTKFKTREEAQAIISKISSRNTILVSDIVKKETSEAPPLLFDLTSLQQTANIKYGLTANETLAAAQALYESGYITYPRTGSRYIPEDVFDELPALLRQLQKYPPYTSIIISLHDQPLYKRSVDDSKVTDHHALLPTGAIPGNKLSTNEQTIYDFIISRLLESISQPCLKAVTNITIVSQECPDFPFFIKGYSITSPGWYAVRRFKDTKEKTEEDDEIPDLPLLFQNQQLPLLACNLLDKKTKAPALLTEATLLAMMESCGKEIENEDEREAIKALGIGTPATRAGIIENLLGKNAIIRVKKSLVPTEKGITIYNYVKDLSIANVALTGKWEYALQKIEQGKLDIRIFNKDITDFTRQIVHELTQSRAGDTQQHIPITKNCPCPKCKRQNITIYTNRVFCPDANCGFYFFPVVAGRKLLPTEIITLCTQGKTDELQGFKSKAGKKFNKALKLDDNFKPAFVIEHPRPLSHILCPKCKSPLYFSPTRVFCNNQDCKYSLFREISGHQLTDNEISSLFTYKRTDVITFVSKQGKHFKAYLTLSEDFRTDFVF